MSEREPPTATEEPEIPARAPRKERRMQAAIYKVIRKKRRRKKLAQRLHPKPCQSGKK